MRCAVVGTPIRQLVGNAHPAGEDVVDRQGELAPRRPGDLDLEVVLAVDQGPEQAELATERHDVGRLPPVPGDEAGRDVGVESRVAGETARDRVELDSIGGPDQPAGDGPARPARRTTGPA